MDDYVRVFEFPIDFSIFKKEEFLVEFLFLLKSWIYEFYPISGDSINIDFTLLGSFVSDKYIKIVDSNIKFVYIYIYSGFYGCSLNTLILGSFMLRSLDLDMQLFIGYEDRYNWAISNTDRFFKKFMKEKFVNFYSSDVENVIDPINSLFECTKKVDIFGNSLIIKE